MIPRVDALSSVRAFTHGFLWNALGRGIPIIIALITTPLLLRQLGVDRWGLFTLALSIIGSFGIFDFGISAALTRALAERIGTPEEHDAPALVVTALAILGFTGVAASVVVLACVPWLVDSVLHVPNAMRSEVVLAFRVLAASGPVVIVNAALWGVLAAYQRFRAANLIGIPIATMYYVAPSLFLMARNTLVFAFLALVVVRLLQTVLFSTLILRLVPQVRGTPRLRRHQLLYLLRIGTWVTISNTLAPLMTYADRFIVGATVSLTAVSHYVTPVDLVWRLTLVPIAVATALYPAVAATHRRQPERLNVLMRVGSLAVIITVFPVCVVMVGLSEQVMALWLGAPFAAASHTILLIVAIGVFFSCLAALPGTMLDGTGHPEIGAFFLIAQAIVFPPTVALCGLTFGIEGAAVVWSLRAALNCFGRFYVCGRLIPSVRSAVNAVLRVGIIGAAALLLCALIGPLPLRLAMMLAAAPGVAIIAVVCLLTKPEVAKLRAIASERLSLLSLSTIINRSRG